MSGVRRSRLSGSRRPRAASSRQARTGFRQHRRRRTLRPARPLQPRSRRRRAARRRRDHTRPCATGESQRAQKVGVVGLGGLGHMGQTVRWASIVAGWVAPMPRRASETERLLVGQPLTEELARRAARAAVAGASPLPRTAIGSQCWRPSSAERSSRRAANVDRRAPGPRGPDRVRPPAVERGDECQFSVRRAVSRATRLNCCTNTESSSRRHASPISVLNVCGRSGR